MVAKTPDLIANKVQHKRAPLWFSSWTDGSQQWIHPNQWGPDAPDHQYFVERVVKKGSRRRQWCIVNRARREDDFRLYPPIVAGPFPNIKAALTAYLVMVGGA